MRRAGSRLPIAGDLTGERRSAAGTRDDYRADERREPRAGTTIFSPLVSMNVLLFATLFPRDSASQALNGDSHPTVPKKSPIWGDRSVLRPILSGGQPALGARASVSVRRWSAARAPRTVREAWPRARGSQRRRGRAAPRPRVLRKGEQMLEDLGHHRERQAHQISRLLRQATSAAKNASTARSPMISPSARCGSKLFWSSSFAAPWMPNAPRPARKICTTQARAISAINTRQTWYAPL